jgi:hypothetical protein
MYTGFASGTFTCVNDCSQLDSLHLYLEPKIKNRFRYTP